MSTILVAAALRDRAAHDEALAYVRAHAKPGVQVVASLDPPPDGVDWDAVRAAEGGWDGIGAWVARTFGALAVVPVNGVTGLSRIVYGMADEMLAAGKPVLLVAPGSCCRACQGTGRIGSVGASDNTDIYDEGCPDCEGTGGKRPASLGRVARVAVADEREYAGVYGVAILHPRAADAQQGAC